MEGQIYLWKIEKKGEREKEKEEFESERDGRPISRDGQPLLHIYIIASFQT